MGNKDETSPGGSAILRHEARQREWAPPAHSDEMERIEAHVERYFGAPETVFHELVSDLVHLDVHVVPPHGDRNWYTLFTTGMSALPMKVPEGAEDLRFAELMIALPPEWNIDALKATPPPADLERWYWPIRWLKTLARLPHEYDTWLGAGHTIPNGDPPRPFDTGTALCGWLLLSPVTVPDEAQTIELPDGRVVHLYVMHALHAAEMSLKLSQGTDALLDAFDRAQVSEILSITRPSAVRRKKLFGLF